MVDLLLDPSGSLERWGDDAADMQGLAVETYGLEFTGTEPDAWAEQLSVYLALVEAWDALGRPTDYPFAARISSDHEQQKATLALVRNSILPRSDVTDRVRSLVRRRETELAGLVSWASSLSGLPTLVPALTDRRVADVLESLERSTDVGSALSILDDRLKSLRNGADARLDTLRELADFLRIADAERVGLTAAVSPRDMTDRYADTAWRVDDLFLRVTAHCRDDPDLAPVRRISGRAYAVYLDSVNQRFTDLVDESRSWPPTGLSDVRERARQIWERPAKPKERRAVLIVDALRLDVAKNVTAGWVTRRS
jgi:hypothetical protein